MTDSGAGLGALIPNLRKKKLINYKTFKDKKYVMPYWGPNFSNDEIKKTLKKI